MLRQGTFIRKKYYSMLAFSLIGWLGYSLNLVMDSLISGLLFGEEQLSAVSIISPLVGIISFFSYLICPGFSVLYAQAIGDFDHKHSGDLAGQSLVITGITSLVSAIVLLLIKEPFLVFFECTGSIYADASTYYNWTIAIGSVMPLFADITCFVTADGDGKTMAIATICQVTINVVLSILLSRAFGIGGLGMGTAIATFICVLIYCSHLFKKSNMIHFTFHFKWVDIKKSFILSLNYCSRFLFVTLLDFLLNKVVLLTCGISFIPAYSIVNFIFAIYELYGAAGDSSQGFLATFIGEKNNLGINLLAKDVLNSIIYIGVVLFALFFFGAPYLPHLYGITSPEVFSACVSASRILSLCVIPYGILYVLNNNFPALNHPYLSILAAFLCELLGPLTACLFAGSFGFNGISWGITIGICLSLCAFLLFLRLLFGKQGFPLYLPENKEEILSFDTTLTDENIVLLRDRVLTEMEKRQFSNKKVGLLLEELLTRIRDKNPGKTVLAELSLFFGENQMRLILRDSGVIFNFIDEDNAVDSLSTYVLSTLLSRMNARSYIVSTAFNRNGFIFTKE